MSELTKRDIVSRTFQIKKFNTKLMVPTVTMAIEVNAANLMKRLHLKKNTDDMPHITVTHMILKAIGNTIVKYPLLYSFFDGKRTTANSELILNIPVDIENHVEYITVHNPEKKPVESIAIECVNEIEKIKNHEGEFMKLLEQMDKMSIFRKIWFFYFVLKGKTGFLLKYYGNFPVSNFGSFGVTGGTLALSQPMIAGLCIGRISEKCLMINHQIIEMPILPLTISFDHRAIDGAYAGRFLGELKKELQLE